MDFLKSAFVSHGIIITGIKINGILSSLKLTTIWSLSHPIHQAKAGRMDAI